jgi:hypothetical protein
MSSLLGDIIYVGSSLSRFRNSPCSDVPVPDRAIKYQRQPRSDASAWNSVGGEDTEVQ